MLRSGFPSSRVIETRTLCTCPTGGHRACPTTERNIHESWHSSKIRRVYSFTAADAEGSVPRRLAPAGKPSDLFGPSRDRQVKNFAAKPSSPSKMRGCFNEITEALEQQTATSEVLRGDFKLAGRTWNRCSTAMLENAVRTVRRQVRRSIRSPMAKAFALPPLTTCRPNLPGVSKNRHDGDRARSLSAPLTRAAAAKDANADFRSAQDAAYKERSDPVAVGLAVELGAVRSILAVPMLKEHELIGSLSRSIARKSVPLPISRSRW